jgi:hypothetical protein
MVTFQKRTLLVLVAIISFSTFMVFFTNSVFAGKENSPLVQPEKFFYLTQQPVRGDNVLDQCAVGYHFAHVWEIRDFSNLTYDTTLGYTTSESGVAPPAEFGWVRAGWHGPTCEDFPGEPDAVAWSQADERMGPGGMIEPRQLFDQPAELRIEGWDFHHHPCWVPVRVWCVSD